MLHSFMITSARTGILLYRKVFTKVLNQPRLIAGLVTALCNFSVGSIVASPVSTIHLEHLAVSVVELPAADDDTDNADDQRDSLRAVVFHDISDGDFFGHVLGMELLNVFKSIYSERLHNMQLGNVEGVEDIFKGFNSHIRRAVKGSIRPLMHILESHVGIKQVFLLGHRRDGMVGKTVDHVWYASTGLTAATLVADVQAIFSIGDDLLQPQDDVTSVVSIGPNVRIQRLDIATLVVVAQPPHTCTACHGIISACTHVLKQRKKSPLHIFRPTASSYTSKFFSLTCHLHNRMCVGTPNSVRFTPRLARIARRTILTQRDRI